MKETQFFLMRSITSSGRWKCDTKSNFPNLLVRTEKNETSCNFVMFGALFLGKVITTHRITATERGEASPVP